MKRRDFLFGAGALAAAAGAGTLLGGEGRRAPVPASPLPSADPRAIKRGYRQAYGDALYHWWDPSRGRIRPTRTGMIDNRARYPVPWEMCIFHNIPFWHWKMTGSAETRAMIGRQFAYVRSVWSDRQLSTVSLDAFPDPASVMVHSSDDAAWLCLYFAQVHEATGDPDALAFLRSIIPTIRKRFADPNHSGLGLLYATSGGDPEHQSVTTCFDAMLAYAALYAYRQRADAALLRFARDTFAWTRATLKHSRGIYFVEADVRPTVGGRPNPNYRKPIGHDRPQDLGRGGSDAYMAGTMAMAALAAQLYRITGELPYLAEARSIAAAVPLPTTFARHGVFVCARDGWTEGYWTPAYVRQVLTLPGAAADDANARVILATGRAIAAQRVDTGDPATSGFYGADWAGPEFDPAHRWSTWIAQAEASEGSASSGRGMARPEQMMTSAQSIAVLSGAAMLARGAQAGLASARNGPIDEGRGGFPPSYAYV